MKTTFLLTWKVYNEIGQPGRKALVQAKATGVETEEGVLIIVPVENAATLKLALGV